MREGSGRHAAGGDQSEFCVKGERRVCGRERSGGVYRLLSELLCGVRIKEAKKYPNKASKTVDNLLEKAYNRSTKEAQVSPSGMAAASQAASGEFDSRHLLQKDKRPIGAFFFLED